ncbi:MAG: glycosyltransferase family 2 protein [Lachnospiraceae bacterium]|nr:glycosyltransferase family 2 protein [Lachnospiraceae bacterium]
MSHIHAFVICAYKKSPYLESCIRSLVRQTVKSDIFIATSTPSEYIDRLAAKYRIPVLVRDGESSIGGDWLFAWKAMGKEHALVTIAHQDDRYHKDYTAELLKAYRKYPDMTVFCSDYVVLKTKEERLSDGTLYPAGTELVCGDRVRFVKKILRIPLRLRALADRTWLKRSVLMFGNSICCPSCTYNYEWIGDDMFQSGYPFALDWDNLYDLAGKPGRFICSERPLLAYRIHDGATTKQCMEDESRSRDEIAMFRKMWPEWAVRILMHFYRKAYTAYGEQK